jgi:hypothetical protein
VVAAVVRATSICTGSRTSIVAFTLFATRPFLANETSFLPPPIPRALVRVYSHAISISCIMLPSLWLTRVRLSFHTGPRG